ncbi:MAG: pseudouridine synthase [Lachnospiraceae bacterium]|nr:pseudouridine synthase [Lachnospiraceae bacterium]
MRLDKYLASAGIGSRKEVKLLCRKGRVTVNGGIIRDSDTDIDENNDSVTVDGVPVVWKAHHYYMLNKPTGVVSSTREGTSTTVIDLLAEENVKGISPVGRLDKDTTGLLILTDDGPLIHELLSPKKHVEKEYIAGLRDRISDTDIKRLEAGVDIGDDESTLPAKVFRQEETCGTVQLLAQAAAEANGSAYIPTDEIHIVLHEGRFHQVKRMLEAVGNEVVVLKRIRMGNLKLDESLREGEYRELTEKDLELLKGSGSDMSDLTDRQVYETPIGPVCMSKKEYEDYLEAREMRGQKG